MTHLVLYIPKYSSVPFLMLKF